MHMWCHVTNHLITSNDKDKKLHIRDITPLLKCNASLSFVQLGRCYVDATCG
jgi:hypothetical protein